MNMKTVTKYFKPIALSGMLLLSVGCTEDSSEETTKTTESESVQNIQAVLNEEFNGPDEELEEIWDGLYSDGVDKEKFKKYAKKYSDYIEENIQPHYNVTNEEDDNPLIGQAYNYLRHADAFNYELRVEGTTIEKSERNKNSYNFTVNVSYSKNETDDSKTVHIRGLMNTNEEGKITRDIYHNDRELKDALGKYPINNE